MEPKLETVAAAEAEVAKLEAEERKTRAEALADDGVIDKTEQAALDRILGKIAKGRAAVAKVRATITENKRLWDAKASELAVLKTQVEELEAWGHKQAPAQRKAFDALAPLTAEEQWKAATAALTKAQKGMLKPYADYLAHKAAKAEYDPMRADADTRLATAKANPNQAKDVAAAIGKFEGALTKIDGEVTGLDFIDARDKLKAALATLEAAETRLKTLDADRAAYDEARKVLDQRLAEVSDSRFAVLDKQQAEIIRLTEAVDKAAAGFDFADARAKAEAMLPQVDALILARQQQQDAKTSFDALAPDLDTALAAVEGDTAPEGAKLRGDVAKARGRMDKEVAEGDYVAALVTQGELAGMVGGFEALLAERAAYLARVDALSGPLNEFTIVRAHLAYLGTIVTEISTCRLEADGFAGALDYPSAMDALDRAETAMAEGDKLIEQRRVEFETAIAPLEPRIAPALACPYAAMKLFSDGLEAKQVRARDLAQALDFDAALATVTDLSDQLDAFDIELTVYEDGLIARIEARLVAVETDLAAMTTPAPSMAALLPKMIADIRAKSATRVELEKLLAEVDTAEKMLADLKQANALITRLNGAAKSNEEAQKIVDELKASNKLFELPTETRNLLVQTLMAGSPPSADDHKAIQDIWKDRRYTDPVFDQMDKETRDRMIAAMTNDPKVTQLKKDWPKLSDAEKEQRVKDITALVAGADGWNTGMPTGGVEVTKSGSDLGGYYPSSDKLVVNVSRGAIKGDFDEFVATIAHEMAHKYQKDLMDGLNATPPTIAPGDARYDQAMMLQLEDVYWKTYSDEFDKIYWTSPSENHSRKVDDEVKKGLKDARKKAAEEAKKAGP